MIWQEIWLSKKVAFREIVDTFAKVFCIDPRKVGVDASIMPILPSTTIKVVVQDLGGGDFPFVLSVYLAPPVEAPSRESEAEIVGNICRALDCDCLISDESVNPYVMLRVNRLGEVQAVSLDVDMLDNFNLFIIKQ
jgi:hypothetical protein